MRLFLFEFKSSCRNAMTRTYYTLPKWTDRSNDVDNKDHSHDPNHVTNWPTYYPSTMDGHSIAHEMTAH